jgi:hypothetical protein
MKNNLASGFLLASVLLLCVSAQKVYQTIRVEVAGVPHAGKLIHLSEADVPYSVPEGHALIITGIGAADVATSITPCEGWILIDGTKEFYFTGGRTFDTDGSAYGPVHQSLGTGCPVLPGQVVDMESPAGKLYILGYTERD